MNVIKKIVLNIAEPLTFICNLSLSHGYSPERMIIANVMPILKSGDNIYLYIYKHIFTNYGPIVNNWCSG